MIRMPIETTPRCDRNFGFRSRTIRHTLLFWPNPPRGSRVISRPRHKGQSGEVQLDLNRPSENFMQRPPAEFMFEVLGADKINTASGYSPFGGVKVRRTRG
jgi:hypothetical protein